MHLEIHSLVSWPPLVAPLISHFTGTKIHENSAFYSKQGNSGIDKAAKLMKTINFFVCHYGFIGFILE